MLRSLRERPGGHREAGARSESEKVRQTRDSQQEESMKGVTRKSVQYHLGVFWRVHPAFLKLGALPGKILMHG